MANVSVGCVVVVDITVPDLCLASDVSTSFGLVDLAHGKGVNIHRCLGSPPWNTKSSTPFCRDNLDGQERIFARYVSASSPPKVSHLMAGKR